MPKVLSKEVRAFQKQRNKYPDWAISIYPYYVLGDSLLVSYVRIRIDNPITTAKGKKWIRPYTFGADPKSPWKESEPVNVNGLAQAEKPLYGFELALSRCAARHAELLTLNHDPDHILSDLFLLFVEGEKCVDALYHCLPASVVVLTTGAATSVATGAIANTLKLLTKEQSMPLALDFFNKVIVWPDADSAGYDASLELINKLFAGMREDEIPKNVQMVDYDQFTDTNDTDAAPSGFDAYDWLKKEIERPLPAPDPTKPNEPPILPLTPDGLLAMLLALRTTPGKPFAQNSGDWETLGDLPSLTNFLLQRAPEIDLKKLNPLLQKAVESFAEDIQVHPDMVIMTMKATAHFISCKVCDVERDRMGIQPTTAHIITLADSGERKSECDRVINRPIAAWQERKSYRTKRLWQDSDDAQKDFEDRRDAAKHKWKTFDANALLEKIADLDVKILGLYAAIKKEQLNRAKVRDSKQKVLFGMTRLGLVDPLGAVFNALDVAAQKRELAKLEAALDALHLETATMDAQIGAIDSKVANEQLKLNRANDSKKLLEAERSAGSGPLKKLYEDIAKQPPPKDAAHKVLMSAIGSIEYLNQTINTERPFTFVQTEELSTMFSANNMDVEKLTTFCGVINSIYDGRAPDRGLVDKLRSSEGRSVRVVLSALVQLIPFFELFIRFMEILVNTGFIPRFEFACPPSRMGFRPYKEPSPTIPDAQRIYYVALELGANIPFLFNGLAGEDGGAHPHTTLSLDPKVKEIWVKAFNKIEEGLRPGGRFYPVRSYATRFGAKALRSSAAFAVQRTLFEYAQAGLYTLEVLNFKTNVTTVRSPMPPSVAEDDSISEFDFFSDELRAKRFNSSMADYSPEQVGERREFVHDREYERKLDVTAFLSKLKITAEDMECALHFAWHSLLSYELITENARLSASGSLALNFLQSLVRLALKSDQDFVSYGEFSNRGFKQLRSQKTTVIKLVHDVLAGYVRLEKTTAKRDSFNMQLNPHLMAHCKAKLQKIQLLMPSFDAGDFNLFEAFSANTTI